MTRIITFLTICLALGACAGLPENEVVTTPDEVSGGGSGGGY